MTEVRIHTANGQMSAYLAVPPGAALWPGVMVDDFAGWVHQRP